MVHKQFTTLLESNNFQTSGPFPPEVLGKIFESVDHKDLCLWRGVSKAFNDTIDEAFKQKIRDHRVEILAVSVDNSVTYSSKVEGIEYLSLRHAHHLCDSIRDLKIDFCTPFAQSIDYKEKEFEQVQEIFNCARDKLTSLWISCGNDEIATKIGVFHKTPAVIDSLILTKYDGEFSKFQTTFEQISRFESENNRFDLLPKFTNLVELTASILDSGYIDAIQQPSVANRLSADIRAYIRNNPKLNVISLTSLVEEIDSISVPTFLVNLIDLFKYKKVDFSSGPHKYTYIHFEKIISDEEETHTIKTTEIDPLIRYEFQEINATLRSSNDLQTFAAHFASNQDHRIRINLYVDSQILFKEGAAFAIAMYSRRFTVTWIPTDKLQSTLVFQDGQLDVVILKNDACTMSLFNFRYWEFNLRNILKFSITMKKLTIKEGGNRSFEAVDTDKYVRFENGQLETNIEYFDTALNPALTAATFISNSKTIEYHLLQFINNNSHTSLKEITIELDEYYDSLNINGWVIDGRSAARNSFIIRLIKKEKTSSDNSSAIISEDSSAELSEASDNALYSVH